MRPEFVIWCQACVLAISALLWNVTVESRMKIPLTCSSSSKRLNNLHYGCIDPNLNGSSHAPVLTHHLKICSLALHRTTICLPFNISSVHFPIQWMTVLLTIVLNPHFYVGRVDQVSNPVCLYCVDLPYCQHGAFSKETDASDPMCFMRLSLPHMTMLRSSRKNPEGLTTFELIAAFRRPWQLTPLAAEASLIANALGSSPRSSVVRLDKGHSLASGGLFGDKWGKSVAPRNQRPHGHSKHSIPAYIKGLVNKARNYLAPSFWD